MGVEGGSGSGASPGLRPTEFMAIAGGICDEIAFHGNLNDGMCMDEIIAQHLEMAYRCGFQQVPYDPIFTYVELKAAMAERPAKPETSSEVPK